MPIKGYSVHTRCLSGEADTQEHLSPNLGTRYTYSSKDVSIINPTPATSFAVNLNWDTSTPRMFRERGIKATPCWCVTGSELPQHLLSAASNSKGGERHLILGKHTCVRTVRQHLPRLIDHIETSAIHQPGEASGCSPRHGFRCAAAPLPCTNQPRNDRLCSEIVNRRNSTAAC